MPRPRRSNLPDILPWTGSFIVSVVPLIALFRVSIVSVQEVRQTRQVRRAIADSWVSSIDLVNAAGLRPQDSAFVGLSNFPSFDRNHAGEELSKFRFGFF
jgi:hypothetical protein